MDALAALYPSATGGSGGTISPLSETVAAPAAAPAVAPAAQATAAPAAAPAPTMHAPERKFTYLSDTPDPDDPSRYLPLADQDDAGHKDAEAVEHAKPVEEPAYVEDRPRIDAAFKDMRDNEIAADSVTAFANFARPVEGVEPIPEGLQAMVKMGLGVTQARAVWDASVDAVRSPVQTTPAGCREALEAVYGDTLDARLSAANAVIADAAKTYPNIKEWLQTTGLGNSPAFVRQVIEFAERRSK